MIGVSPKLVNRMYNRPLIGDAIINPCLLPCISQKLSSMDFGCSHPASRATSKSRSDDIASPVDGEVSNGSPAKAVWLMSESNTIEKRMVDPGNMARKPLMNYWLLTGARYTCSNALSSDQ